jgi:hypothetical protein
MKCVAVTQPETTTCVASHNRTVIAVAVTTGLVLLVAVATSVVILLHRKRGLALLHRKRGLAQMRGVFQHPASRNEMPEWMCGVVIVE